MLEKQLVAHDWAGERIVSVFFGGGTPTTLDGADLKGILMHLRDRFEVDDAAEIRTEANPDTVDRDRLQALLRAGFDRLSMGAQSFARALREAGLCGAIVPDLPFEEAGPLRDALAAERLDLVPLVAPTTPAARAATIARSARGFVYYVSVTGVTGSRAALPEDLQNRLGELRAVSPVPVAVGFGISRPEQAAALKGKADGVVVGTALVATHHEKGLQAAADLVRSLRAVLQ